MRLNPYRNTWYYPYGALTYFVQRKYGDFIALALKGPLTEVWIDMPAYLAAAYARTGDQDKAAHYLSMFTQIFQKEIAADRRASAREMIDWIKAANPFRSEADTAQLIQGVSLAGLDCDEQAGNQPTDSPKTA